MELPKPPDDPDVKNIIDKLANFVARNGPEFEHMTKQKQKDNPKFAFLFGGEHYNYYQYRVQSEQAIMNAQKAKMVAQHITQTQLPPTAGPLQLSGWQPNQPAVSNQVQQLQQQIKQQQDIVATQIKTSETNLTAQYQSMVQRQQIEIEETIMHSNEEKLLQLCHDCAIPITQIDGIVQPIIQFCTKDSISAGKNWMFANCISTQKHCDMISQYLLKRIVDKDATFELRLHLIYLINDILHHCQRKNSDGLKVSLDSVLIPIFCSAHIGVDAEKQQKLSKLLGLWEKNGYFAKSKLEQLKDPATAMSNYQANLITENASLVTRITSAMQEQYTKLQQQHNEYAAHLNNSLQQQIQQLQQQITAAQAQATAQAHAQGQAHAQAAALTVTRPTLPLSDTVIPPVNMALPPPGFDPTQPPPSFRHTAPQKFDYAHGQAIPGQPGGPPPGSSLNLPDFSKPPPGFAPLSGGPPPKDADLMPTVPYYELPAGLMAPLVMLEDCDYKPLDPKDIRLPPPMPPTERLLLAVEAFYSPPSHERPRDGEGWEKLGLYEFFKAKEKAKRMSGKTWRRQRSRSSSPIKRRRRYASRSRSNSASRSRSPSSRSQSRSRSKSMSPPRRKHSRSGSRSRSRSRSYSPKRRRHSRSKSRSISPPSFAEPYYTANVNTRLGDENKGHMLLKKMGWGGCGLGAKEQGREDPINATSEVREKMDMYAGIGVNIQDPFEQFRKHRAQGFIARMRSRDESRKAKRKEREQEIEEEDI